ncbi:MAG: Spy/CpxP family protein refolding chaperone [Candidatus Competibacteraceae bacterium]
MNLLRKRLLIAATVAGLSFGTAVFAGPGGMGGGDCPMMGGGKPQRMAMMQQHHAEQMELLEARLKLTANQTAAWKAFTAAQDTHRTAMKKMWQEKRDKDVTAMSHFEEQTQAMEENLTSMKAMTKAASDLYAALDPTQKKVMDDFITTRPMHGMMRGGGPGSPPAQTPAQ